MKRSALILTVLRPRAIQYPIVPRPQLPNGAVDLAAFGIDLTTCPRDGKNPTPRKVRVDNKLQMTLSVWHGACIVHMQVSNTDESLLTKFPPPRMSKEKTMKRSALILTVVGTLALMSAPAMATDNFYFGFGHAARRHVQTHVQLNHRAQHRDITHHNAHHYPLTYGQHGRLHYQLNHQAAHDRVSHYRSHATRHYYGGYGQHGVNIRIGGISFGFGH